MSVADVLAAARAGGTQAAEPASPATDDIASIMEAARKPTTGAKASAKPSAAATPKKDVKSMSVEEVLAAARGQTGAGGAAPLNEPQTAEPETSQLEAKEAEVSEPTAASATEPVDELPTDVEGILAFCRQRDG